MRAVEMPVYGRRSPFHYYYGRKTPLRYAYIGFYTLTDAQKAREMLERRGILSRVTRMPSEKGGSCAYGLKLPAWAAATAQRLLADSRIRVGKTVYRREEGD